MICPYCMEEVSNGTKECKTRGVKIPPSYTKAAGANVPIIFVLTIGLPGHGKTCFLSSLFATLREELPSRWPQFSLLALTQPVLDRLHQDYLGPLLEGHLPAKTPVMFPEPLMVKLQRFPLRRRRWWWPDRWTRRHIVPQNPVFVFYDVGGEHFHDEELVRSNIPIVKRIKTLQILIDLAGLVERATSYGESPQTAMTALANRLRIALEGLDRPQSYGNLVICFTRSDVMEQRPDFFGPLGQRTSAGTPGAASLDEHVEYLLARSSDIDGFVRDRYPAFHAILMNNFAVPHFVTVSALGQEPDDHQEIPALEPHGILDPLLMTLHLEGWL